MMIRVMPESAALRAFAANILSSGKMERFIADYEKCRMDVTPEDHLYTTFLYSVTAASLVALCCIIYLAGMLLNGTIGLLPILLSILATVASAVLIYYARMFTVRSNKDYRGALIDASAVHAVGFMLTMAESNVPLKRMFFNLSNLKAIYGEDIALESSYILSLVDEDGMDILSALGKAQATSPSAAWQDLLIGIAGVYSGGGSLKDYLKGRYDTLAEQKKANVRRFNGTVQGLSSIFLSVVGIAAIFVALINLVFNMASLFSSDALVWLDALIIVPLGTFAMMSVLRAANPEV